jgi:hypothetical protein
VHAARAIQTCLLIISDRDRITDIEKLIETADTSLAQRKNDKPCPEKMYQCEKE